MKVNLVFHVEQLPTTASWPFPWEVSAMCPTTGIMLYGHGYTFWHAMQSFVHIYREYNQ